MELLIIGTIVIIMLILIVGRKAREKKSKQD